MADAAAAVKDPPETSTPPATEGAPAKGTPPAAPPPKAEGAPSASTTAVDDDDQLGVSEKNGKKFIKLPYEDFKKRVLKSTKKDLRTLFGTDDPKALAAIKKKFDDFEKDAEARKVAEMTDRQKLEAERDSALTQAQIATRRAESARDAVKVAKTGKLVRRTASEHVHADKLEMAVNLFRADLRFGMSKKRADKFFGHEAEWFKAFVEKNPEFAKSGAPPTTETKTEPTKERKPASNGLSPNKTEKPSPTPPSAAGGKKVADMTPAELRDYAAKNGVKLPSDLRILGK